MVEDVAQQPSRPTEVFYDGGCGLCHRTVRLVLGRDRRARFRFAPIGGATWDAMIAPAARASLPDSVVVARSDGRLLARTAAVVHLLWGLGGGWRVPAGLLWIIPRPLRDLAYRGVAAVRARLFRAPDGACPLVPAHLKERFDP